MPYGACNATAHFERMMDAEITQANLKYYVCSFVDDILIHSKTMEEHISHVEAALEMLEGCNPDKTVIGAANVEFFGHNVSAHGLHQTIWVNHILISLLPKHVSFSFLGNCMSISAHKRCNFLIMLRFPLDR